MEINKSLFEAKLQCQPLVRYCFESFSFGLTLIRFELRKKKGKPVRLMHNTMKVTM
jgi:hypothetical protein